MIRKAAVALAALMTIVGCTTVDPITGEREANRTANGAIIGAIVGAVLSADAVTVKAMVDDLLPSLTVIVTVEVPNWFAAGVTVTVEEV